MIRQILFPVDFSASSVQVLPYVLEVAQKFQAKVHILYVSKDFFYAIGLYVPHPTVESFTHDAEKGALRRMKEFFDEHLPDRDDIGRHVRIGDPAEEIVKFAADHDIDMIIMGTQGRRGLESAVFGSVAASVVRTSPVPVMTIKPSPMETSADALTPVEG